MSMANHHAVPDVCIVGAGPAGAVSAKRFAEAGFTVVCLEQGEWPDYSAHDRADPAFELHADTAWTWNPNARGTPADYPINDAESDISALMWNGVGGGSVVYASQWMRNAPSDFRVRSLDGVADDWPLSYFDLEPYYRRVEYDFGVSGLAGDPAYPPMGEYAMPPVPLGAMGTRIAAAHNELGRHWWPGTNAIATRAHGPLSACVQRATCLWGCADGAKGTADVTHWAALRGRPGVRLLTGARANRVVVGRDGRAQGVEYTDRTGQRHLQRAGVVVLCANGIGTPRLLLLSADSAHPDGLANSSGLVGKRLMMHPCGAVVGVFDDDLRSWQGAWGQTLYSLEFYETDTDRGFVRGAKWALQPTGSPIRTACHYPWDASPIWGEGFQDKLRARFGHSALWVNCGEDLPEESNSVALDEELTDSDGAPAVKLRYRTGQNAVRMLDFHAQRAVESLEAAGAYETIVAPQLRESGWHLLGTAVMGTDPATSVVDPWGRTHDVDNVFVFDGSTWPTSAGMNPTATIAALALRNAEHLIEHASVQRVAL